MSPQTLGLLGSVLFLLIAVVGGGFTAREVTIPKVPSWARVAAAIVGVLFSVPFFLSLAGLPRSPSDVSESTMHSSPSSPSLFPSGSSTLLSPVAAFGQLDTALQLSAKGRALVNKLQSDQDMGCSLTTFDPISQVNAIIANRTEVQRLAESVASSGGPAMAKELSQAMQASVASDGFWSVWLSSTYRKWRDGGCQGQAQTTGDLNWDQFIQLSKQATYAKQQFTSDYNAQAAQYGFRHDWQLSDF